MQNQNPPRFSQRPVVHRNRRDGGEIPDGPGGEEVAGERRALRQNQRFTAGSNRTEGRRLEVGGKLSGQALNPVAVLRSRIGGDHPLLQKLGNHLRPLGGSQLRNGAS